MADPMGGTTERTQEVTTAVTAADPIGTAVVIPADIMGGGIIEVITAVITEAITHFSGDLRYGGGRISDGPMPIMRDGLTLDGLTTLRELLSPLPPTALRSNSSPITGITAKIPKDTTRI